MLYEKALQKAYAFAEAERQKSSERVELREVDGEQERVLAVEGYPRLHPLFRSPLDRVAHLYRTYGERIVLSERFQSDLTNAAKYVDGFRLLDPSEFPRHRDRGHFLHTLTQKAAGFRKRFGFGRGRPLSFKAKPKSSAEPRDFEAEVTKLRGELERLRRIDDRPGATPLRTFLERELGVSARELGRCRDERLARLILCVRLDPDTRGNLPGLHRQQDALRKAIDRTT